MTRFPPIPEAEWSPAQRRVAEEIRSGPRGDLRGPFVPLIYSPELAACVQKVGEYLRFNGRLPLELIELAVLVTARRFRCAHIWHSHRALALKAGLPGPIIAAVAEDRRPDSMDLRQAAVHDFCHELAHDLEISDTAFERVVTLWDRTTAIDLTGICGYYGMLAMVLNTARPALPAGARPFEP
ncbi:MAG: carboxymuconolactone decarboxylase family protein [Hyphomicrobiales bacterium]|nr:carboxymuconolactone decarboxylase family protein [Hyphomicrobiales bacterium]